VITARLHRALDDTIAGRRIHTAVDSLRHRRSYRHWTDVFGIVTFASIAMLMITGAVLSFFYAPSSAATTYHGSYAPLRGAEMSHALASTLGISFDVRGGLLVRQGHHWAALLLPASIIGQLVVTFFTGGFRRPRQWAWVLLFLTLIAALAAGWSGYALPDDLLSGTGLRIVEGIVLGIPVVGTWVASLLFGGPFPGRIIENLWVVHLLVSVALLAVVALRARAVSRLPALHFRGVDAVPLLPTGLRRSGRIFITAVSLLVLIAATVTVSPVWLYGRSDPGNVSAGSQPDWYTGFLDGALRLVPPGWEIEVGGYTLTLAVLVPLAVIGAFLLAVVGYPFIENWTTRDRAGSLILDRPRDVPTRTAIGVAGMTFYGVLWGAASADLLAHQLGLSLEGVLMTFQVLLFAGPVIGFVVAQRVCLGLQRKDRDVLAHGYETGRIVRMPGGEYIEVHAPVSGAVRERMVGGGYAPLVLRPDRHGRISLSNRMRVLVSRALFRDRIAPVTGTIETAERDGRDQAA
jgi:ubiquinol-cytochrome c reductase cytochrome b subunit